MTTPHSINKARVYELLCRARRADEELGEAVKRAHSSPDPPLHRSGSCLCRSLPGIKASGRGLWHLPWSCSLHSQRRRPEENVCGTYGKVTGAAKGKGGSMHLIDVKRWSHGYVSHRRYRHTKCHRICPRPAISKKKAS